MLMYSQWLQLSLPTRHKIASEFGIVKKNPTHVFDNVVKDDGYLVKDIEATLTVSSMQKYLNTTETNHVVLWNYLVDKMEGKNFQIIDNPPTAVSQPIKAEEPKQEVKKEDMPDMEEVKKMLQKKKGRPKKYEEKTSTQI